MNTITRFLKWLKSLFANSTKYYTGANPDPRSSAQKMTDYLHEERLMPAGSGIPYGNTQISQSPFFYENQNSTSSCEPHGIGLALAIERFKETGVYQRLSWLFNYRLRSNYPGEGCFLQNVFANYQAKGAPAYTELPDVQTEDQADDIVITPQMYTDATVFAGLEYFQVQTPNNIDTLNAIAEQGHAVAITIYATYQEWAQQYPTIIDASLSITAAAVNHCICILPNSGFMLNGKKYLVIQDSAWFGNYMLRYISEDFIKARVYGAGYWDKVSVMGSGPHPVHVFTNVLAVGMRSNEVQLMQQLLISEGLLPNDCATGYFGGLTLAGVHAFQAKYAAQILTPEGLTKPTDTWGKGCITQANILCS